MGQNRFPAEFLQQVAAYLSLQDYYQCIYVCRFWRIIFQRLLYRTITLYSNTQLRLFLASLEQSIMNGYWIRKLYLEVFCFNIADWEHLQLRESWISVRQWSPLPYATFISNIEILKHNLTHLHIQHSMQQFLSLIDQIYVVPYLEHLTLELMNDDSDSLLRFSNLQQLHRALPNLLNLTLIRSKPTNHRQESSIPSLTHFSEPSSLKTLTLDGYIDSFYWFDLIRYSYPNLQELNITHIIDNTSEFDSSSTKWRIWQSEFTQLIQALPLITLRLGGQNIPSLFSKSLVTSFQTCTTTIQYLDLDVDFEIYQANESFQFLRLLDSTCGLEQLRKLKLKVWEQIPGWSGVTSSHLLHCKGLLSLELALPRGLMDQFPYTPFLIDYLLMHLTQLEELVLIGAHVQVIYNQFKNLDFGVFALRKFELRQSRFEELVTRYLSRCCPRLETVILECEVVRLCELVWQNSRLTRLQVNWYGQHKFVGIQVTTVYHNYKKVWCHWDQTKYQISKDEVEQHEELNNTCSKFGRSPKIGLINIQCQSISCIFFNDMKIPIQQL
ncbi:uncharacterized protein BX663DRAFT_271834 [Cokeromyces recurvatus]|uniref:uncharacterized protein n=1 Tax=Cokeromyces recurvatus TaxID=90255 RepID=UPI00221E6BA5|nr:uncharacterized protein BX663DRAFT_271834 [Cokeromyces recurvatus]KAI7898104.1 hypothetical protein BX663DRAFT_271834 [Cokeromyces recurvatus]